MFFKVPLQERPFDMFERDFQSSSTHEEKNDKIEKIDHEKELLKLN
jgi:hypothetical protein